jgi:hypothetical protein
MVEARVGRLFALFAVAACGGSRVEPSSNATPATRDAGGGAIDAATSAARDWMWQAVGGERSVYWRWQSGACELWHLEPEGIPADNRGSVFVMLDDSGVRELKMSYEGGGSATPLHVASPQGTRDTTDAGAPIVLDLPCREERSGAWYLDRASCEAAGPPPLVPIGCSSQVDPDGRTRIVRTLQGAPIAEARDAIAHAASIWTEDGCHKRVVRVTSSATTLTDESSGTWTVSWTPVGVDLDRPANPDWPYAEHWYLSFAIVDFGGGIVDVASRDHARMRAERWWIGHAPPAEITQRCGTTNPPQAPPTFATVRSFPTQPRPRPIVPELTLGPPTAIAGNVPADDIELRIRANRAALQRCYETRKTERASGAVVAKLVIDSRGQVIRSERDRATTTMTDAQVVTCVVTKLSLLHFESRSSGTATVTYPIVFSAPP